ncbi:hypothetical protein [Flavobacterium cellulosilyticum]|uniref:Uncharacterized protein n=1 Tax=Flavobacterium cellulosilyticum TaxID=2541731 RepID=A0A4R5CJQ7_9FLAO|nr:hypothetical protein [Flavobacterium cellulosilyticum]TDD98583.1 hypothetical protein E0F76_05510 [Flavobacterium cellulosilyticum]
MKTIYISIGLLFLFISNVEAQEFKESVQPLSSKSQKGYMYDVSKEADGSNNITFKAKADKKSEEVTFEKYSFDKNLKFINTSEVQEKKEQNEDVERTSFYAYVGGTSSFDVLSMKLKINKRVQLKKWNHEKQLYVTKKTISDETIKPRNDNGKVYYGYASYVSSNDTKSDVLALAKVDSKDKKLADQFVVLVINDQLELKEKPLELEGSNSLVFCKQIAGDDVVAVFAPNKNQSDISKYVYFRFDIQGNLKNKTAFTSPASALLITAAYEKDDAVYFFGSSTKSKKAYEEVYKEYASIFNPANGAYGNSYLYLKWKKSLEEDMDNFHLIKINGNQLDFASTTPISDFKSKFKTAQGDKGASVYKGKNFYTESFFVTDSEDYLIAGQLIGSVNMGMGNPVDSYEDIVCFHFDKMGNLKAQYGIGKMNNDKKSEIFDMSQKFYLSSDGKSVYWELMEIKGVKGYESFLDAYYNNPMWYATYFPRIVKIDLSNNTLGAVKVLGEGKYFLKKDFTSYFDKSENSLTYIGLDEDFKQLWIGKMMMK